MANQLVISMEARSYTISNQPI